MRNRNFFWGFFFMAAAVFVIGTQTGAFGEIGLLSILAAILLVAIMLNSLMRLEFFGIFMPAALLYLIFAVPLGLVYISAWILFLSAVLLSIGFSIVFGSTQRYKRNHRDFCGRCNDDDDDDFDHNKHRQTYESVDDNNPFIRVSFGSKSKYLHAEKMQRGNFSVSFGELNVYLDQVQLDPQGAEVFVDCSFGEIKLFVPRSWQVVENVRASLGGVENRNMGARASENAPKLVISGNVQFGNVEINYI